MPSRRQFKDNESYNKYFREYRLKNVDKMRKYYKEYNKNWRAENGYHNEIKWKKENHLKVLIEKALQRAVKRGEIKKCPCVVCQSKKSQAHHEDYNRPLKVFWLCSVHHKARHQKKISLRMLKELLKLKSRRTQRILGIKK